MLSKTSFTALLQQVYSQFEHSDDKTTQKQRSLLQQFGLNSGTDTSFSALARPTSARLLGRYAPRASEPPSSNSRRLVDASEPHELLKRSRSAVPGKGLTARPVLRCLDQRKEDEAGSEIVGGVKSSVVNPLQRERTGVDANDPIIADIVRRYHTSSDEEAQLRREMIQLHPEAVNVETAQNASNVVDAWTLCSFVPLTLAAQEVENDPEQDQERVEQEADRDDQDQEEVDVEAEVEGKQARSGNCTIQKQTSIPNSMMRRTGSVSSVISKDTTTKPQVGHVSRPVKRRHYPGPQRTDFSTAAPPIEQILVLPSLASTRILPHPVSSNHTALADAHKGNHTSSASSIQRAYGQPGLVIEALTVNGPEAHSQEPHQEVDSNGGLTTTTIPVYKATYSPSLMLIKPRGRGPVQIWDADTLTPIGTLPLTPGPTYQARLSLRATTDAQSSDRSKDLLQSIDTTSHTGTQSLRESKSILRGPAGANPRGKAKNAATGSPEISDYPSSPVADTATDIKTDKGQPTSRKEARDQRHKPWLEKVDLPDRATGTKPKGWYTRESEQQKKKAQLLEMIQNSDRSNNNNNSTLHFRHWTEAVAKGRYSVARVLSQRPRVPSIQPRGGGGALRTRDDYYVTTVRRPPTTRTRASISLEGEYRLASNEPSEDNADIKSLIGQKDDTLKGSDDTSPNPYAHMKSEDLLAAAKAAIAAASESTERDLLVRQGTKRNTSVLRRTLNGADYSQQGQEFVTLCAWTFRGFHCVIAAVAPTRRDDDKASNAFMGPRICFYLPSRLVAPATVHAVMAPAMHLSPSRSGSRMDSKTGRMPKTSVPSQMPITGRDFEGTSSPRPPQGELPSTSTSTPSQSPLMLTKTVSYAQTLEKSAQALSSSLPLDFRQNSVEHHARGLPLIPFHQTESATFRATSMVPQPAWCGGALSRDLTSLFAPSHSPISLNEAKPLVSAAAFASAVDATPGQFELAESRPINFIPQCMVVCQPWGQPSNSANSNALGRTTPILALGDNRGRLHLRDLSLPHAALQLSATLLARVRAFRGQSRWDSGPQDDDLDVSSKPSSAETLAQATKAHATRQAAELQALPFLQVSLEPILVTQVHNRSLTKLAVLPKSFEKSIARGLRRNLIAYEIQRTPSSSRLSISTPMANDRSSREFNAELSASLISAHLGDSAKTLDPAHEDERFEEDDFVRSRDEVEAKLASQPQRTGWNPMAYSRFILSSSLDCTLAITDLESGEVVLRFGKQREPVDLQAHGPRDTYSSHPEAKSAGSTHEESDATNSDVCTGHTEAVLGFAFCPVRKILASFGLDKQVILWDIVTQSPIASVKKRKRVRSCYNRLIVYCGLHTVALM